MRHALIVCAALATSTAVAVERRVAFWPDDVTQIIQSRVDGAAVLETVRSLGRFHRVHGSPGFAAAAEYVRDQAAKAGLADARVERFPTDGRTRYGHFLSYLGWSATRGVLEEVSPRPEVVARFPEEPVALADYSQDADVTAALVDVGRGASAADYSGRDVAGKIVLASGPLAAVAKAACLERGAVGIVSDFPNQTTAWSGDDRDLVRWGHLSPYETRNRFAFMVSKRRAQALRERLASGDVVRMRARVQARMVPATLDVVTASIPGTDPGAGEIALTAHLCHQSAGANDNASGSAAILEVARALAASVADGRLPRPRLAIRFLWLPEIAGSQAWLISHPEIAPRIQAGIHMDMVGGTLAATRGTFHLSHSARSLPHIVDVIAEAWFRDVQTRSARYAERGGFPTEGLAWLPGSREAFLGDVRDFEMGSDHEVFQDGSFSIPMVYFHDWPDVTIHTNKDQPENLDATKLGRVAYLGAGIAWTLAALPEAEIPRLVALAEGHGDELRARALVRRRLDADARDGEIAVREADAVARETMRSLNEMWPGSLGQGQAGITGPATITPGPDRRVPLRSRDVRGPLSIYYYDHLEARLGEAPSPLPLLEHPRGDVLAYEALNLVDGRRTVSDIRDVLTGRYETVDLDSVSRSFDVLARAGVVSWKGE